MNSDLVNQFIILQNYNRQIGDNGRVIGYGKLIVLLKGVSKKITSIDQVKNIRGIGQKAIEKITEYLQTGQIQSALDAQQQLLVMTKTPTELAIETLTSVWGIGEKKAEKLIDKGITTIEQLRQHPELLTDQQKIGLKYHEQLQQRIPRESILVLNIVICYFMNQKFGRGNYTLTIAGSYRRNMPTSGDIDCLITGVELEPVVELLREKKVITDVLAMKNEKFMGIACCPNGNQHYRLDIEYVSPEQYGSALLYFTGSKDFNKKMRWEAKKRGLLLNEHGLFRGNEKVLLSPTEKDIFDYLEMEYVNPENR